LGGEFLGGFLYTFLFKLCVINKGYEDKLGVIEVCAALSGFLPNRKFRPEIVLTCLCWVILAMNKKGFFIACAKNLMQVNVTSQRSVKGA
jgi:hypothetical protein